MADATQLRLVGDGDRELYRALYSSPEVMRAISDPLGLEAIDAQFSRVVAHNCRSKPGHRAWVIERCPGGHAVGLAALLRDELSAEFGVMLLPDVWQLGIGTATIRRLLIHAFEEMRVDYVHARSHAFRDPVIERLLAPFGLERREGEHAGESRWFLPRGRWPSGSVDGLGLGT